MKSMNATLYYYCSTETFQSIIEKRKLWLSEISKSNDCLEQRYLSKLFFDNFDNLLKERFKLEFPLSSTPERLAFDNLKRQFISMERLPAWCMCLSGKPDLLSQWRGYGDDGYGMCIGFCADYLNTINELNTDDLNLESLSFEKVKYGDKALKRMEEAIDDYFRISKNKDVDGYEKITRTLVSTILAKPIFKHDSFAEEDEWRIVFYHLGDVLTFKEVNERSELFRKKFLLGEMGYISKKDNLISHIELEILNMMEAIDHIIIGPKSKLSVTDVNRFLRLNGINYSKEESGEKIIKSKSSYKIVDPNISIY